MKLKKILSLVSCCALFVGSEVNPISSFEIFKTVRKTANYCFGTVRYTGTTLTIVLAAWGAVNYKRGQLSDAVTPLVCALICAGIGYGAWKLEKWTDTSENSNSQKQGNENKDELLHSNAGMQSK